MKILAASSITHILIFIAGQTNILPCIVLGSPSISDIITTPLTDSAAIESIKLIGPKVSSPIRINRMECEHLFLSNFAELHLIAGLKKLDPSNKLFPFAKEVHFLGNYYSACHRQNSGFVFTDFVKGCLEKVFTAGFEALKSKGLLLKDRIWISGTMSVLWDYFQPKEFRQVISNLSEDSVSPQELELLFLLRLNMGRILASMGMHPTRKSVEFVFRGDNGPIFARLQRVDVLARIRQSLEGIEESTLNEEFIQLHNTFLLSSVQNKEEHIEPFMKTCLDLIRRQSEVQGKKLADVELQSVIQIASHLGLINDQAEKELHEELSKNKAILSDYDRFKFEFLLKMELANGAVSSAIWGLMSPLTDLRSATWEDFENLLEMFRGGVHDGAHDDVHDGVHDGLHDGVHDSVHVGEHDGDLDFIFSKIYEAAKYVEKASSYLDAEIVYDANSKQVHFKSKPRERERIEEPCSVCLQPFFLKSKLFQVHEKIPHLLHLDCYQEHLEKSRNPSNCPMCNVESNVLMVRLEGQSTKNKGERQVNDEEE